MMSLLGKQLSPRDLSNVLDLGIVMDRVLLRVERLGLIKRQPLRRPADADPLLRLDHGNAIPVLAKRDAEILAAVDDRHQNIVASAHRDFTSRIV
jgi:hypothetical protein